jgi:hypothetical protein
LSALAPAPEVAVASSGAAGLVGGQAFDAAVFTGKRCKRGQQQACWSSGSAVPEHDLEQFHVDLDLLPRTELREQDPDHATRRSPAERSWRASTAEIAA